jgi:hypothetical protein
VEGFTKTTFGLLIAYPLPGLIVVVALSEQITVIRYLLKQSIEAQSPIGAWIALGLLSCVIGLLENVLTWLLIHKIICCKFPQPSWSTDDRALDENFRYSQFYGNVAISLVLTAIVYVWTDQWRQIGNPILVLMLSAVVLLLLVLASREAYRRYVKRLTSQKQES